MLSGSRVCSAECLNGNPREELRPKGWGELNAIRGRMLAFPKTMEMMHANAGILIPTFQKR